MRSDTRGAWASGGARLHVTSWRHLALHVALDEHAVFSIRLRRGSARPVHVAAGRGVATQKRRGRGHRLAASIRSWIGEGAQRPHCCVCWCWRSRPRSIPRSILRAGDGATRLLHLCTALSTTSISSKTLCSLREVLSGTRVNQPSNTAPYLCQNYLCQPLFSPSRVDPDPPPPPPPPLLGCVAPRRISFPSS